MHNENQNITRNLWQRLGFDMPDYKGDKSALFVSPFLTPEVVNELVANRPDVVGILVANIPQVDAAIMVGNNRSLIGDRMMMIQLLSAIVQHAPHVLAEKPKLAAEVKYELSCVATSPEITTACQEWARAGLAAMKRAVAPRPARKAAKATAPLMAVVTG